ncbi:MAG: hypothetical protein MZV70_63450 [Desulfobacterales bacterium]|nr:hypothetical protein [Desulfobacterales bacterium]
MFTDFTYDNLGLPRNVNIPGNPPPDPGLAAHPQIAGTPMAAGERGKHKVMGLRNIAVTAPYGHNGVFRTLEEIVHFYNTRDTKPVVCTDNTDPRFAKTCWPAPEIGENVNTDELWQPQAECTGGRGTGGLHEDPDRRLPRLGKRPQGSARHALAVRHHGPAAGAVTVQGNSAPERKSLNLKLNVECRAG